MGKGATRRAAGVGLFDGTAQVLEAVRLDDCRTRGEIMQRTGLSRMVTAQRVQQLLDLGLLHEEGLASSSGGRPARRLAMPAHTGSLLAAHVGWTSLDVAVGDLTGRLVAHVREPADVTAGPEVILARIEELFDSLNEANGGGRPWGIGLGLPAPVEFGTGHPVSPPGLPLWDNYPVRERLAERYAAPAWVDNDVNTVLLGEWREGAAQGHQDAVLVKLGTGIGAAMISDGRLHRGALGCAGNLGHLLQIAHRHDDGSTCRQSGCPEGVVAAPQIIERARQLVADGRSPWLADMLAGGERITPRLVRAAAAHGDEGSLDLVRRSGALVGTMLASVVSLLNPSLVVISGGLAGGGDIFVSAAREVIYGQALPLATRDLRVVESQLGPKAGIIGAIAMALDQMFSDENLQDTVERHVASAS